MSAPPVAALTAQQFEALLDVVSDAVLITDNERRIVAFNRQAELITGVQREDAVGRSAGDILPSNDGDTLLASALHDERSATGRIRITTPERGPLNLDATALPLYNEDGMVIGGAQICRLQPATSSTENAPAVATSQFREQPDTSGLSILDATEREAIERVLRENGWNQGLACRALGISRTTLWRKMKKLKISAQRRGTVR